MTCCSTRVERRTFEELADQWPLIIRGCAEPTFSDQYTWQATWWSEFGLKSELNLLTVSSESGDIEMIAPLMVDGTVLSFLGSTDLVDYHDFLARDHFESDLFGNIVKTIDGIKNVESIVLQSIPGNSASIDQFRIAAERSGWIVNIQREDVAPRIVLPNSWDEYVSGLRKKDRHELRRKLRRLDGAGDFNQTEFTRAEDVMAGMDDFMLLHRMSTTGKADFMTTKRERFFRRVAVALAYENSTRLCFLELNGERVATSLSFVCRDVRYLYNSGYNPAYSYLSVGLLNHALSIRCSIEQGHRVFDFMRGAEAYKYHLGGVDREVYAMTATRSK